MYYYHVWEKHHPHLTNGNPLYDCDIYSVQPIETDEQLKDALAESILGIVCYDKISLEHYELIPMPGKVFIKNLICEKIEWTYMEIVDSFCERFPLLGEIFFKE